MDKTDEQSLCNDYRKRLQEQEDAAKAYRDFVASFDDDAGRSSSTSGRVNDTSRGFKGFVKAGASCAQCLRFLSGALCRELTLVQLQPIQSMMLQLVREAIGRSRRHLPHNRHIGLVSSCIRSHELIVVLHQQSLQAECRRSLVPNLLLQQCSATMKKRPSRPCRSRRSVLWIRI